MHRCRKSAALHSATSLDCVDVWPRADRLPLSHATSGDGTSLLPYFPPSRSRKCGSTSPPRHDRQHEPDAERRAQVVEAADIGVQPARRQAGTGEREHGRDDGTISALRPIGKGGHPRLDAAGPSHAFTHQARPPVWRHSCAGSTMNLSWKH